MIYSSPCPGRVPLPISLYVLFIILARVFIPTLAFPTLSIFLHPNCHSCRKLIIVILFSYPPPSVPVPITAPKFVRAPGSVILCLIDVFIPVFGSISSPFQTVFQFWAAVLPQCKRGRGCRQCVRMKDWDEGHRSGQSAWTTNTEHG